MNCSYPVDFAAEVNSAMKAISRRSPPLELLQEMAETLYFASLRTEEGQFTKCTIVYVKPYKSAQQPAQAIRGQRCIPFESTIPLTVNNLTKLAQAADPQSTALAIYKSDSGRGCAIWGLIDQQHSLNDYSSRESDVGPEVIGWLRLVVVGPGSIMAFYNFQMLAALRQHDLLGMPSNVFIRGPIGAKIRAPIESFLEEVKIKCAENATYIPTLQNRLVALWRRTLLRVIIRVQRYGHGGAIVLMPGYTKGVLDIKYKICYKRLHSALVASGHLLVLRVGLEQKCIELGRASGSLRSEVHDGVIQAIELENAMREELTGAVGFVASLSRVDGLVLLDESLVVQGFGGIIGEWDAPERILVSSDPDCVSCEETPVSHFGTRHRSMFRLCYKHPEAIGIVVSQDGDVRVCMRNNDSITMWSNVKLRAAE
jgi:hypothetical protein